MKKIILPISLAASILFTSCLGTFSLTNSALDWNREATNNKIANNLLFIGLAVVQFYTVTIAVDVLFLNLLEFWDGKSPMNMVDGEIEQQVVKKGGKTYQITATKNNFELLVLKGENEGELLNLRYLEEDQSWNAILEDGQNIKLSSWKDGFYYVHTPDQGKIEIESSSTLAEGLEKIKQYQQSSYCFN